MYLRKNAAHAAFRDRKQRHGDEDAERERRGGRQRPRRRLEAGDDGEHVRCGDEQEQRADEGQVAAGIGAADLADLVAHADDEDFEQVLPARHRLVVGKAQR